MTSTQHFKDIDKRVKLRYFKDNGNRMPYYEVSWRVRHEISTAAAMPEAMNLLEVYGDDEARDS